MHKVSEILKMKESFLPRGLRSTALPYVPAPAPSTAALHLEKQTERCGIHAGKITASEMTERDLRDALQMLEFENASCKDFSKHLPSQYLILSHLTVLDHLILVQSDVTAKKRPWEDKPGMLFSDRRVRAVTGK